MSCVYEKKHTCSDNCCKFSLPRTIAANFRLNTFCWGKFFRGKIFTRHFSRAAKNAAAFFPVGFLPREFFSAGIFSAGFLFAAIRAAFVPTYQPVKRLIFGTTRFYNRGTIGDDFVKMRQIRRRNGEGRLHPLDMSNGCNRPFPFLLWILRILVKSSPIVPRIKKRVLAIFTFFEFFNNCFSKIISLIFEKIIL